MKNQRRYILLLSVLFGFLTSCDEYTGKGIYERPEWLPGKLYTTVFERDNLSMFAECLRLTGLDTIIDVSGSLTVFAPTNEAMEEFLLENHYAGISAMPYTELERMTKFHIIQNPWSFDQLKILSYDGWRKENDNKKNSFAYKRQTILKNPIEKSWIKRTLNKEAIVGDSVNSDGYKKVFVESRKYVPIFYDDFVSRNNISSADYNFYFDRPYESGNVYYANGKIIESDIFAENGFVHIIDRVVKPMLNAREMLERELPGESYQMFTDILNWYYPTFEANMEATTNQPAFRLGALVDTLWDLKYSDLPFAIHQERIGFEGANVSQTLFKHSGLFVPTDNAFIEFVDNTLTMKSGFPHWRNTESLPKDVVDIIISPHFKTVPIYPSKSQYREIFKDNGQFRLDEGDIIRQEFGSNCTFIGLDAYKPNRVFTSVTGPVFLRPAYSLFRRAMLYSDVHESIANHEGELYFFPIPDYAFMADSSLIINWINKEKDQYNFTEYNREKQMIESLNSYTLKNRILNHVGTSLSKNADMELIQTLGGRILTWDHTNNTIRGTYPCTIGYMGKIIRICTPVPLEEPTDNGKTWTVKSWFNF